MEDAVEIAAIVAVVLVFGFLAIIAFGIIGACVAVCSAAAHSRIHTYQVIGCEKCVVARKIDDMYQD